MHWGDIKGQQPIKSTVMAIYDKVVTWIKNIMPVPRGESGEKFIAELSRLLDLFNNKTAWEPLAIHMFHIFIPMMLQKPSAKSKAKDHVKYLLKRLQR